MRRNVYSVGQVNAYIKNMFAQDFMLRQISVSGEISNCKYHSSGHIYFTLKDSSGIIQAVMFAGNRRGLTFHMKEGTTLLLPVRSKSMKEMVNTSFMQGRSHLQEQEISI